MMNKNNQAPKQINKPAKINNLPHSPGVYFHKDKSGQIIYIGKAAVLSNRVKQYFQSTRDIDVKTRALIAEIADIDWVETDSEIDALFLEAEMIKRYMPRYNILLRDDKSLIFVRIDIKSDWPYVSFTRNPADDGAEYFGPYYNGFAVKKALRYLRKIFPYYDKLPKAAYHPTKLQRSTGSKSPTGRLSLDDHLGLSPISMTSDEYKTSLRKLISYIKGNRKKITAELESEMKKAAKLHNFENAAKIRNKLHNLRELQRRIMFGDKEFLDISKDKALRELTDLLKLPSIPVRIEGYDVSHIGGTNVVASMVVFKNGVSDRNEYRKFKTHTEKNDDFYNMNEIITRRFSQKNLKSWGKPDLILIDGGKGQLHAATTARDKLGQSDTPFIGLAKKQEQIVIKSGNSFRLIDLPKSSHIIKLLQRIRDESHHFAVSYHTTLRQNKQTANSLQEISGIGPKTYSKLIRKFGSMRGVKNAPESDIVSVVGIDKANKIIANL